MLKQQNIIIRLPNWLGDMVMCSSFVQAVAAIYPDAKIDLIAKKGIDFLLDYFPPHDERFIFSKDENPGLKGALAFGKHIRSKKKYDLFFCLPDSFSAAVMAYGSAASKRIGFKNEMRSLLLTNTYSKQTSKHRVEEYNDLLQQFSGKSFVAPPVNLLAASAARQDVLIFNINSEASSRRLPFAKAVSLIATVRKKISNEIVLIGSPKEKDFVTAVFNALPDQTNINNVSGSTNLPDLVTLIASSKAILTTDSGPAHVANALGVYTIVLFGAGNEYNTAPYNKAVCTIIRLGELPCEPCTKNTCRLYDQPKCLEMLDEDFIASTVEKQFYN